jgi:prolyl oligopeptidase
MTCRSALLVWTVLSWAGSPGASEPPAAPVHPVVDDYFGTRVTDNYRWMEDQKSAQMQAWLEALRRDSRRCSR